MDTMTEWTNIGQAITILDRNWVITIKAWNIEEKKFQLIAILTPIHNSILESVE